MGRAFGAIRLSLSSVQKVYSVVGMSTKQKLLNENIEELTRIISMDLKGFEPLTSTVRL
jgi:hypothetical protein